MTDDAYAKVREVFHQVCDLDPTEQLEQINSLCAEDTSTKSEVLRLLAALNDSQRLRESFTDAFDLDVTLPHINGYTLIRILGEGSMGTVYEAQQQNPSRRVSIKTVRIGANNENLKHRFEREAQALARLKHPGIAQIYTTGISEFGRRSLPYITLELVEGKSLLQYSQSSALDTKAKLELACKLCEAVHYAHTQGVVHRDLKPSNILVEATGQPKVLDFGIARITDSDIRAVTLQTQAGQILGTAAYMSPEQALGNPDQLDARTDIYSLGVLIYELLTNRRPHQIDHLSIPDAIRTIRENEPTHIGSIDTRFRGDLGTIVAKALEKEPARRYQSAQELSQDIERFLQSEPIIARPTSVVYRLQKFTKRNKAVTFSTISVFIALTIGLIGTSLALERESQARKKTSIALIQAQSSTEFLESILLSLEANEARGRDTELIEHMLSSAAESVDDIQSPSIRANMLLIIGQSYFLIFEYEIAIETLTKATIIYEALGSDNVFNAIKAKRILADSLRNNGQNDEAIQLLQESLTPLHPKSNPDQQVAMLTLLAEIQMGSGNWTDAIGFVEHAQEIANTTSAQHTPGLNMLNGMLLRRLSRFEEAESLYLAALETYQAEENWVQVSKTYGALGLLAKNQGQFETAEAMYRQSLDLRTSIDPRPNPDVAILTSNIGKLLLKLNRHEEAIQLLEQSIQLHREVYGDDHFAKAFPIKSLAQVNSELGQHEKALELINYAIDIFSNQFGDLHHTIATAQLDKGSFLIRAEQFIEAQECLETSLSIATTMNLNPIAFEVPIREQLAEAFDGQGLRAEALSNLEAAYNLLQDQSGPAALRILNRTAQILRESE